MRASAVLKSQRHRKLAPWETRFVGGRVRTGGAGTANGAGGGGAVARWCVFCHWFWWRVLRSSSIASSSGQNRANGRKGKAHKKNAQKTAAPFFGCLRGCVFIRTLPKQKQERVSHQNGHGYCELDRALNRAAAVQRNCGTPPRSLLLRLYLPVLLKCPE